MTELVQANGVELCIDTFGSPTARPILLIHGAAASMDFWEPAFCMRLANAGRYVIRYDHRDTGQSVSYPPGEPAYSKDDLAADALGILDALQIPKAHLVGLSMGGWLTQLIAVHHPERTASVTFIANSPTGPNDPELPPMSDELKASFSEEAPPTDWSDPEAALDAMIAGDRLFAGNELPYDEPGRRASYAAMAARTKNLASAMTNHWMIAESGSIRERLCEIAVPALVLHGTADPLFAPAHGEALAREIPGARFVALEGAGHELPKQVWPVAIPEILAITG